QSRLGSDICSTSYVPEPARLLMAASRYLEQASLVRRMPQEARSLQQGRLRARRALGPSHRPCASIPSMFGGERRGSLETQPQALIVFAQNEVKDVDFAQVRSQNDSRRILRHHMDGSRNL